MNGNQPEYNPMADIAQATNEMVAMAAQRQAEEAVLQDAQVVLDNTEWNSLTPQEQEAQMAADEAKEEAHLDQRRAELEEDIERYASDPEAVVDGPGCSVRDLDAHEAAMDAALDDPEPELG